MLMDHAQSMAWMPLSVTIRQQRINFVIIYSFDFVITMLRYTQVNELSFNAYINHEWFISQK